MPCSNYTAQTLRFFICGPFPPFSLVLRGNILRTPPPVALFQQHQQLLTGQRLIQILQHRRVSTSTRGTNPPTDDDYIPFITKDSATVSNLPMAHGSRRFSLKAHYQGLHRPLTLTPLRAEPEIFIVPLEEAEARQNVPQNHDIALKKLLVTKEHGFKTETEREEKMGFTQLLVKSRKRYGQARPTSDSTGIKRPKKANKPFGEWALPPIEPIIPRNTDTFEKLQYFISTTNPRKIDRWRIEKGKMQRKLAGQEWKPLHRLSPTAIDGIRMLHSQHPEDYPTGKLAELFKVSPEAIRRILKSKWRPNAEEMADRLRRWDNRRQSIWEKAVGSYKFITKLRRKKDRMARWNRPHSWGSYWPSNRIR